MSEPLPVGAVQMPLRIVVKGPSTVNWTSWMGGPRTDFPFPRAMEEYFLAQGRPAELRVFTQPGEKAVTNLSTWQEELLGFSPDVVVLLSGQYEALHLFLPKWLERHANSLRGRPRRYVDFYRQHLLRPVWRVLSKIQARVDRIVNPNIRRRRPHRVVADLERYVTHVQKLGSPMMVFFEFLGPSARNKDWYPGYAARLEVMNDAIRQMVERLDQPHIIWFPVAEIVEEMYGGDLDLALPDGFHYTPELHREIGHRLGAVVAEWADTQPHLMVRDRDQRPLA
ncbi:SGNH/GDSL hydrolase family protein [Nocardioides limicola]|uniref:SGNH/GDSL hydrolase family protein n=1 Tax=Nocardioides limicola TaxID=2803368 RepID=UPI00193C4E2D|nr:SGNH/GDSL hydrolase family protein [Nocardioides sp. DJM-14]